MSYTPSLVVFTLVVLGVVINFTTSQQEFLIPDIPQPPHIRATLDQPEVHLTEEIQRRAVHLADTVTEGAEAVKETVEDTVTAAKDKIVNVKDKIKHSAETVKDTVKEKVHNLREKASETKENIKDTLKQKHLKHPLKRKEIQIHWTERIVGLKDSIVNWFRYFFTGKQTPVAEIQKEQLETFPGMPVYEVYEGEGGLSEAFEKGKELLGEAEEVIEGKAKGVKDKLFDKFSKVKESAKDTVKGIKEKFGYAKEKAKETVKEGKEKLHKVGEHIAEMTPTLKGRVEQEYVYDDKDFLEDFRITYEYHYKKSEKPTRRYITTH